jgi:hypothetical protein
MVSMGVHGKLLGSGRGVEARRLAYPLGVLVLKELVKRHQIRPANPKSERVFRRAITETPRHNAKVILG